MMHSKEKKEKAMRELKDLYLNCINEQIIALENKSVTSAAADILIGAFGKKADAFVAEGLFEHLDVMNMMDETMKSSADRLAAASRKPVADSKISMEIFKIRIEKTNGEIVEGQMISEVGVLEEADIIPHFLSEVFNDSTHDDFGSFIKDFDMANVFCEIKPISSNQKVGG